MELLIIALTLVVAIYAVVPRERQLELRFSLRTVDLLVFVLGFLAVLYLEFYDTFSFYGLAFSDIRWPHCINRNNGMLLVVIILIAFFSLRLRMARLSVANIHAFRDLCEELLWSEDFATLFGLVQKHSKNLFKILRGDLVSSRLRERFTPPNPFEEYLRSEGGLRPRKSAISRWLANKFSRWVLLLPTREKEIAAAKEVSRSIFLSEVSVASLVRSRPYMGLRIIQDWGVGRDRFLFADMYLAEMMKSRYSVLYAEIQNNQNQLHGTRYDLPDTNRLLHFFLSDASRAKEFRVYKPIGDFVKAHLDSLARDPSADPYLQSYEHFEDQGLWRLPVYVGIRFFDIMLNEALWQGIQWHMWLYYVPRFVERMTRNYQVIDPLADPESEFPIVYSYLLYSAFVAMKDWVLAVQELGVEQSNIMLKSTRADHENGNVPKSSMLALSESLRSVLNADQIGDSLQTYLADIVFTLYFELCTDDATRPFADTLRAMLIHGGTFLRQRDLRYRGNLLRCFKKERMEYGLKYDEDDVLALEKVLENYAAEP